ncbi:MAG TPA: carbon-nitrogen hydrolase family protein [Candidatus Bathyarchaeia archaeon]|nr:carbon-nitrogen hydrolase family protein [Candidatus Bathyarchaeia archaeon]
MQTRPIDTSVKETIFRAVKQAKRAAENEADVICLPEHWLPEKTILSPMSPLPGLQSLAEEYGVVVVGGAFYERIKGRIYLNSPVIGRDGEVIGRQSKVHLFYFEKKIARPGNDFQILNVNGFKLGVLVCYDVDFPEAARILTLRGADLLMCPSRIVRQGVEPWHQYVTIRSLENRIAVVAPNVYSPPLFTGYSMIVSLKEDPKMKISYPKVRVLRERGGGIIFEDIDLALHARLRKQRFADRRPETYVWN